MVGGSFYYLTECWGAHPPNAPSTHVYYYSYSYRHDYKIRSFDALCINRNFSYPKKLVIDCTQVYLTVHFLDKMLC